MKIESVEDIRALQKPKNLTVRVYSLFSENLDSGFKNRIQQASVSIINNRAEGFEYKSNNEFSYFLYIANGSGGEVRSMLILGKELNKIIDAKAIELTYKAEEVF